MKRILSILLAVACLLSLVACGTKNDENTQGGVSNEPDTSINTPIEETGEKQEAKYSSERFSSTALEKLLKDWNYIEEEDFGSAIAKINGRIIDVQTKEDNNHFLTASGFYELNSLLMWTREYNIDIGNNTKIITICRDTFTLADENGKLTVFGLKNDNTDNDKIVKWEEIELANSELFVGGETYYIWDDLYVFTDINKDEMTVKVYSYNPETIYSENVDFGYIETLTIPFKEKLDSNIKEYIISDEKYCTEGFILLENGELLYVNPLINSVDGETHQHAILTPKQIAQDVEKVWNAKAYNSIIVKKNGDDKNLYLYTVLDTDNGYSVEENVVAMPDNLSIDNINDIIEINIRTYQEFIAIFSNGDVYGHYKDAWTYLPEVTNAYKQCGKLSCMTFEGKPVYFFDDGYLYVHLNDDEYEKYGK